MEVEPGVAVEPPPHAVVLVGAVVVQDDVDVESLGHVVVDRPEEDEELLVAVAAVELRDHGRVQGVQSGE